MKIMELSKLMENIGLTKLFLAFWCKPHLINQDSNLLCIYTFTNQYVVKHFSEKEPAIQWLKSH